MVNYSVFKRDNYSWKRLIIESNNNDKNSGYSYCMFLNDMSKNNSISRVTDFYRDNLEVNNSSLEIKSALASFTYVADVGIKIFLGLMILGSILIVGIFSFAAYNDEKHTYAILQCLGAKRSSIISINLSESLINIVISLGFSFIFSSMLQCPLNDLIFYKSVPVKSL